MAYRVYLDTNIIADHLLDRNKYSSQIIYLAEDNKLLAFSSSATFFTLAYVIDVKLKMRSNPILSKLNQFITVIPTTQKNLHQAYASNFDDLEDAFQYFTALNEENLDYFITNNVKDFSDRSSHLPVLSAIQFVNLISK